MSSIFELNPSHRVAGRIRVPGDKSISHRSVMLGAIAEGITEVSGFLEGADAISTMNAFRAMGVRIDGPHAGRLSVHGVGLRGLRPSAAPLDCGNSGTSMRLLSGLLCGHGLAATLIGDASLSRRPMKRVIEPLRAMGARIDSQDGRPPLVCATNAGLRPIRYAMPVASAQVKSALLLAGLYADGVTEVSEPAPTRDHTERMLGGFGWPVQRDGTWVRLRGPARLSATRIDVPADISSAAFFIVAAAITPGSDLTLTDVGINPTRTGVVEILRRMGADIELQAERDSGGEPIADLRIRHAPLRGIDVPAELVPLAIDEFPALFVAAACAAGRTVVRGAEELRVKESDRIAVMADGLQALGAAAVPTADGMIIDGKGEGAAFGGARIDSHGDHRIAMAFAVASLRAERPIRIDDCDNVGTSFPNFVELAQTVGIEIQAR